MINYREILRLHSLGYSQRRIGAIVRSSRNTVSSVLKIAEQQRICWPLDGDVTDAELDELLSCRAKKPGGKTYVEPDYAYIHKELAKKGVTLTLLWEEYCERCRSDGKIPYMSAQFGDKYRRWACVTKATMRIRHKPGDAMQVDWAGETIPYFDPVTGEEYKAYIFVAALPCSCYIYAEACTDMQQENWLLCHVHAFEYFGGAARLLIPDNTRTGVISNTRYETRLNESYNELAAYYGTSVIPTRVRKPRDKSIAEGSVNFSTTWITAALRDRRFLSFDDVYAAVKERLEVINNRPFKKRPGNRREAYLSEEKEYMIPLPKYPYEPSVWKQASVGNDYLVSDGLNKYSVPFDLIGSKVQMRLTKNTVEIFFNGSRVTSHKRLKEFSRQPIVKTDHMPENHRKYLSYNEDSFRSWANGVGKSTAAVVDHFLSSGTVPEQGYKPCVSLMKLCKRYDSSRLEAACERMLSFSSTPSVRNIASILTRRVATKPPERLDSSGKYGITRGAAYFGKGGDRDAE